LLDHFEQPDDDDMRTFIEPEKAKGTVHSSSLVDPRTSMISRGFGDPALKALAESSSAMPRSRDTTPTTSSAIVRIDDTGSKVVYINPNVPAAGSSPDNPLKLHAVVGGRYKPHERHHYVGINASSFVSCTSPTGAYSELAFVLWLDNRNYVSFASSTDRYRLILSVMYDAEEDLWCLSAKLLKRASYYATKDEDAGTISNRLCDVSELRSEIKKMLLYLGISPRQAYRLFRRNLEEETVINDSGSGLITVETASHSKLMKELEKTSTTTSYPPYTKDYHGYQVPHHGSRHNQNMPSNHIREPNTHNYSALRGMGGVGSVRNAYDSDFSGE
jgi:hypothetical protein